MIFAPTRPLSLFLICFFPYFICIATDVAVHAEQPPANNVPTTSPADLAKMIRSGDAGQRRQALQSFREWGGEAAPAVDALIEALHDNDGNVRLCAANALAEIGPDAKAAVPALIAALNDDIDANAARALGRICSDPQRCVPALIDSLNHGNSSAAEALGNFGADAKAAVPALIKALKADKDGYGGEAAALGEIKSDPQSCVPVLLDALKRLPDLRKPEAAAAIGEFGAAAKEAVPALIEALKSDDDSMRWAAAGSLGKIGPDAAVAIPELQRVLNDPKLESFIAPSIIKAFAGIGKAGLPTLIDLLKNEDRRYWAADAIRGMKESAADAVPSLIEMLKQDEDGSVRDLAACTLADLGAPAKAAVPTLVQLARDPESGAVQTASHALYKLDPQAARDAGVEPPVSHYTAWIQQKGAIYRDKRLAIESGPADGPLVVWVNGDPTDFYAGGGSIASVNEWLQPGKNELTFSGTHRAPVYVLLTPSIGRDLGPVTAHQAFANPGGDQPAPPLEFDVEHAPKLPQRELLSQIPRDQLQKDVEQQMAQLVELIRGHHGKQAAELLYAGERLWSRPAADHRTKDFQKEIDEAAQSLSHPQTTVSGPPQAIKLLIGKRAAMAFVEEPNLKDQKSPPLFALKNGDNESQVPFLIFARVDGKLIVWEKPSGFSMTLSGSK